MKRLLLAALFLLPVPALAQDSADLPSTQGMQVVDRDLLEVEGPTTMAYFYAVLSTDGDQSYLDIYKGIPFKRIHRWAIDLNGDKVKVGSDAVLVSSVDDDTINWYWREFVGYREGAVSMALTYHRKTGRFTTAWAD